MLRLALVYLLVCMVFYGILTVIHARITPAVVVLPLIVWPDVVLLSGLGRMDHRSTWICRILGMCALLWTYALKFI